MESTARIESTTTTFETALNAIRSGRHAEAERLLRDVLKADDCHLPSLHFLGILVGCAGNHAEAIDLFSRALRLNNGIPEWHLNLGLALKATGRLAEAAVSCRRALALRPSYVEAHNNLGSVLKEQEALEEATACFEQALALRPDYADAWHNLGLTLRKRRLFQRATECHVRAWELNKTNGACLDIVNSLYAYHRFDADAAAGMARTILGANPGCAVLGHGLLALVGDAGPERANDNYVQALFDGFASSFDETMQSLNYAVPERLAEAFSHGRQGARPDLDILDAGCGTGFCGPLFRPLARTLVGVDLSPKMLSQARRRAVYDRLVEQELVAYLSDNTGEYDLIVAADVFVYFGDLVPALLAAASCLREDGRLAFSVEKFGPDDATGFRIQPSGRYRHTEDYLRRQLGRAGFEIQLMADTVARYEYGHPTPGLLVIAARRAANGTGKGQPAAAGSALGSGL